MKLDTIALIMVGIVVAIWAVMFFIGTVFSPFGWILPAAVALPVYLLYRVIRERLSNAEDDYYDKNVRQ